MLLFGHLGITAGVVKASEIIYLKIRNKNKQNYTSGINGVSDTQETVIHTGIDKPRKGKIDYRMVLAGSILPDLIDKPIFLLLGDFIPLSGRDYAHTLLFSLLLIAGGLVFLRNGRSRLLVLAISGVAHLLLDQIWNVPVTLWWPLLGPIQGKPTEGWIGDRWYSIFTLPEVYIPEIIGLVILLILFLKIVRNKRIFEFIRTGIID
jgi:hypothetical protein